jgi:hypothetical protein
MTQQVEQIKVGVTPCQHCGVRLAWHPDGLCDMCWKWIHARKRDMTDPALIPRRYPDYLPPEEPSRRKQRGYSKKHYDKKRTTSNG